MGYPMGLIHPRRGGHHDLGVPHGTDPPMQRGVTIALGYPTRLNHPPNVG